MKLLVISGSGFGKNLIFGADMSPSTQLIILKKDIFHS